MPTSKFPSRHAALYSSYNMRIKLKRKNPVWWSPWCENDCVDLEFRPYVDDRLLVAAGSFSLPAAALTDSLLVVSNALFCTLRDCDLERGKSDDDLSSSKDVIRMYCAPDGAGVPSRVAVVVIMLDWCVLSA